MIGLRLDGYDPDLHHDAAVAFCIRARDDELFSPRHQHRKGQLILALHGAITCEVENAMWMVPPQYAVWLPGSLPHSNHVTAGAELCFLFIEPAAHAGALLHAENFAVMPGVDFVAGAQNRSRKSANANAAPYSGVV